MILGVHGMGGAPEDFEPLGRALAECGFFVEAVTVRGQGLDPDRRRRGHFLCPEVIADDIVCFADELARRTVNAPIFLCGESLGALLASYALASEREFPRLRGVILSAPVVSLARETPSLIRTLLALVAKIYPRGRIRPSWFVNGGSNAPKVSRDEAWVARQRSGPRYIPAFTFHALDAFGKLMATMPEVGRRVMIPSMVLAAGNDVFVQPSDVKSWYDQIPASDKTYREYPDSYHVLWNDFGREAVIADIISWIEARV